MHNDSMQAWLASSFLSGGSLAYIEDRYESYLHDPQSVSAEWQQFFQQLPAGADLSHAAIREQFILLAKQGAGAGAVAAPAATAIDSASLTKQLAISQLIQAYRSYGHKSAQLDPLKLAPRSASKTLGLEYYQLTSSDLNLTVQGSDNSQFNGSSLQQVLQRLEAIYCGSIGYEYQHIGCSKQRQWLRQRIESRAEHSHLTAAEKLTLLERLTAAEGLERYLGSKYVGQKRFSLEGGESLIPLLDTLIAGGAAQGVQSAVIGMAHRGRLNVLINTLGKDPQILCEEFEGKHQSDQSRSWDVKYHMGYSADLVTAAGPVHVSLAFNPSHLEIVSPVVAGSARARQDRQPEVARTTVLPIQIHGDAAFAGQGVVMETFALSQTRGFSTAGSVHIVINNQVGFTTSNPQDTRSSRYCTDIAKMIDAPIIHVNGDDPEAVAWVAQLAIDYRMHFKRDVVIDLVCYRRHGHNEADEPSATQPVMYQTIKALPTTRALYADALLRQGVCEAQTPADLVAKIRQALDEGRSLVAKTNLPLTQARTQAWQTYADKTWTVPADTAISLERLQTLAKALAVLPEGFKLQAQVAKMMEERNKMTSGELPLNWGYAETLGYASLVTEQYALRLCGQDAGRGTFAHRHAVLHHQTNDECYIPLAHLAPDQAPVTIIDSLLSEEAVLAYEYGYATTNPDCLVLWEAQFGDFANGAQVVIDQFLSSADQKWGRLCGLVLLLPHGYEGAGPEHSSARLERFLQLCAQENMQVCVPTTPAQIFHLLRRQMLRAYRKPLIVMTPKSLLRHKLAVSKLSDLTQGSYQVVLAEQDDLSAAAIKRVILCSGKVYYDLLEQRREQQRMDVAIIRLEQLYPFPTEQLQQVLAPYQQANSVVWCQEEPQNQGAWYMIRHKIQACLTPTQALSYAGRAASASTATGYGAIHLQQQAALVAEALGA